MKILSIFALLILSVPVGANVYKWTDASGAVHFSDKPAATAAEKLDIETQRTEAPQLTAQLEEVDEAQDVVSEQDAALAAERERVEARRKIQRGENCTQAKRARDSLLSATRVYEALPGGGRRYLEDDEVARRKADAERDVEQWCNDN
ncbi:MAG: DUF4124 domain-containing protein [Gammaproteobacteria bacterium]|nr:DUF4124 domain-containing protein [Gammaproteobacteria bacterium]